MLLELNTTSLTVLIASLFPTLLGLFVYAKNRKSKTTKQFFYFTLTAGVWGFLRYLIFITQNDDIAYVLYHLLYPAAALMPISFLFFVEAFLKEKPVKFLNVKLSWLAWILMSVPSFIPTLLIKGIYFEEGFYQPILSQGWLVFYDLVFISVFVWSYFLLVSHWRKIKIRQDKLALLYILIGTGLSVAVGIITHLILPVFGIFSAIWAGPISTAFGSFVIVIGILRYKVFDLRIIGAHILVFVLWLVLLIQFLSSRSFWDAIVNASVFIVTVTVSIALLNSMEREIQSHEKLEQITKELRRTNRKLKKLDQEKSEFLSIATHQLRTPLTSIRGYLSMILEGDFGKVPDKIRPVIERIYESSSLMSETITDFLNVSRIELGHMEYYKKEFYCMDMIKDTLEELKPKAKAKNLELVLDTEKCPKNCSPVIYGDYGKIKYIFSNLIENAIKYTPKGKITISGSILFDKKRILISIKDTGIGIDPEEIPFLFSKFKRARNAKNINIKGTGLGLYVAKEMVKAHGGRIWVYSEGVGKGTEFFVELPFVRVEKCQRQ